MLMLTCPYCGPRAETEFTCGGEADIVRPQDCDTLTDAKWADYAFMRKNVRGRAREQWQHAHGCRRWFLAERDTVSHEFHGFHTFEQAAGERR
ncbi:sarcosine oxidase subunit delta [Achromobacter kerstersii]